MKKVALLIIYIYALCCPLEFVLNVLFGSSVKFIAAAAVLVTAVFFLVVQKYTIKFTAFQFCLIGWAALEATSVLWTNVTSTTYETLLSYLMMAAFVILLSLFPFERDEAELLVKFYTIGTVVLAVSILVVGSVDGSEYTGRLTASILGKNQDPNGLAAILLSGIFYTLHKTFESKKYRICSLVAFLVQSIAIFFTGSRGGLVAYVIALVIYIAVKIPKNKRLVTFLVAIIVAVAGYFVLSFVLPERLFNRLFDFSSYLTVKGVGRISLWTEALKELMQSPAIGFGTTSHLYHFSRIYGAEFAMHNTYLCVLFEVGFVGFMLFIIPYILTYANALKRKDALIVAIISANIVAAFFLDSLYLRFLWNALIFGVIYKNSEETPLMIEREKKA